MSARLSPIAEHVVRVQRWLKDPAAKPFRISIAANGMRSVRRGQLVLGVVKTDAEAWGLITASLARYPLRRTA